MINLENLVWITIDNPDDFLKIKETLTRIGIASKKNNILYQSCHILHKQGKYAIVHFKELFLLDGKAADFSENDIARRNTIVNLLTEWKLLKQVDPLKTKTPVVATNTLKIIPYSEKANWTLEPKYNIGNVKKKEPDVITPVA